MAKVTRDSKGRFKKPSRLSKSAGFLAQWLEANAGLGVILLVGALHIAGMVALASIPVIP